jgi:ribonuclease BN (tRNA processing enzyme)
MQLRILGCSGGIGEGLNTTCYLLDGTVLIDAGTGAGELSHPEMCALNHVFLTHSHLDHVAGLPLLVDTMFDCLDEPLLVHAQEATITALQEHLLNWTIWPNFAELPNKHNPVMTYQSFVPGDETEAEGAFFQAIPVEHVVPCVAYAVHKEGRTFCFSGDTTTNDSLWKGLNALERLDLLLVECAFPNAKEELSKLAKHYCPSLLAEDLKKLRHRPRVAITHMKPGGEEQIWAELEDAIQGFDLIRVRPGDVFEI